MMTYRTVCPHCWKAGFRPKPKVKPTLPSHKNNSNVVFAPPPPSSPVRRGFVVAKRSHPSTFNRYRECMSCHKKKIDVEALEQVTMCDDCFTAANSVRVCETKECKNLLSPDYEGTKCVNCAIQEARKITKCKHAHCDQIIPAGLPEWFVECKECYLTRLNQPI